jgi:hypothetical protein
MHPMTRCKPLLDSQPRRPCLDDLPEDILISIFSQCRIDELLALRLASSMVRNLISRYMATIAPCVARSTFPHATLLVTPPEDPSDYTVQWLTALIPQHLAAILVDRHRFTQYAQPRYGIPAEDAYGEVLRARVANGWRVLRSLSNISEEVYSAKNVPKSTTDIAWKVVHPSRYKFEVFQQRENLVLERRMQYINDIPDELAKDYKLLFLLLSSAFRTSISNYGDEHKPWIFDWSCGIDGQRLLRRGDSWLTWFVLHEGPQLFWDQWWKLDPQAPKTKNHIRDRSIEAWFGKTKVTLEDFMSQKDWYDVNQKCHAIQRDYVRKVHKAIDEKVASSSDFTSVNPILYFTQYAECRLLREEVGVPAAPETLSHVPFHIDFRCPDEVFHKFRVLQEEKAVAFAAQPSARA